MAKHQRADTRFSGDGCTALVKLRVDRRMYEFARYWAEFHAKADPAGTAEDQLEGYLNMALLEHIHKSGWTAPPEIEALYPEPSAGDRRVNDLNDDIPY